MMPQRAPKRGELAEHCLLLLRYSEGATELTMYSSSSLQHLPTLSSPCRSLSNRHLSSSSTGLPSCLPATLCPPPSTRPRLSFLLDNSSTP